MDVSPSRKRKLEDKIIVTHSGKFHCDEVLACYLLLNHVPEFFGARLVRTRDESEIKQADVVVDVGGVYDPKTLRFDHHQRNIREKYSDRNHVFLSSAGLVYRHFKSQIADSLCEKYSDGVSDEDKVILIDRLYHDFVMEIDAADNGFVPEIHPTINDKDVIYCTTNISARVENTNLPWNSETKNSDVAFRKAMKMVGDELESRFQRIANVWLPAKKLVEKSWENKSSEDPWIILETPCPWVRHLKNIQNSKPKNGNLVKFALFPSSEPNGEWRVQAFYDSKGGPFNSFPENWKGLAGDDLKKVSGIAEATFVHKGGFIGGATSKEGAVKMATASMVFSKPFKKI